MGDQPNESGGLQLQRLIRLKLDGPYSKRWEAMLQRFVRDEECRTSINPCLTKLCDMEIDPTYGRSLADFMVTGQWSEGEPGRDGYIPPPVVRVAGLCQGHFSEDLSKLSVKGKHTKRMSLEVFQPKLGKWTARQIYEGFVGVSLEELCVEQEQIIAVVQIYPKIVHGVSVNPFFLYKVRGTYHYVRVSGTEVGQRLFDSWELSHDTKICSNELNSYPQIVVPHIEL